MVHTVGGGGVYKGREERANQTEIRWSQLGIGQKNERLRMGSGRFNCMLEGYLHS